MKVSYGTWPHLKVQLVKDLLPYYLVWLLTEFSFSKVITLMVSLLPWHLACGHLQYLHKQAPPIWCLAFQSMQAKKPKESENNKKFVISYNPITEVRTHNFCCILVIRSKSLGQVYVQGKGTTPGGKQQEVEIIWDYFKGHPPWSIVQPQRHWLQTDRMSTKICLHYLPAMQH